jgi:hypothetical protein
LWDKKDEMDTIFQTEGSIKFGFGLAVSQTLVDFALEN